MRSLLEETFGLNENFRVLGSEHLVKFQLLPCEAEIMSKQNFAGTSDNNETDQLSN